MTSENRDGTLASRNNDAELFRASEGSLVFINTCFGFAFGSVFFLLQQVFTDFTDRTPGRSLLSRFDHFWWLFLPTYLVFTVWVKYRSYYIPLQYYRNTIESNAEEGTTYSITLLLGTIGLCCAFAPPFVLPLAALLILLILIKTRQMRHALEGAPGIRVIRSNGGTVIALEEIDHQSRGLKLNLFLLSCIIGSIYCWRQSIPPLLFAFLAGFATVLIHFLAKAFYNLCYPKYRTRPVTEYLTAVSQAWK